MKLGIFLPNASNGYIISKATPQFMPSFQHNLDITKLAEEIGLEFVLSMIKYRGFGGEVGYWDGCLDSFTLTGALANATSRIKMITTIGVLSVHPAVVARALSTLDDISGGRVALNVVAGWNVHEYQQMGMWRGQEHFAKRYDYAAEYVQVLRELWTEGRSSFAGEYFTLDDCHCYPKPKHDIEVVSAGQSPAGIAFTAKHAEYNFTAAPIAGLGKIVEATQVAAKEAARKVGTLAYLIIVAKPTDEEAEAEVNRITEMADQGAIANLLEAAGLDPSKGGTSERMIKGLNNSAREGNLAFNSCPVIYGSYENVARQLDEVAALGLEGALLVFPDYLPDLKSFGENVLPKMQCRK